MTLPTFTAFPTTGGASFESNARNALERWRENADAMGTVLQGFGVDTGTANAHVVEMNGGDVTPTAYNDGMTIVYRANLANTGAVTINVDSLGAKAIKKHGGEVMVSGDIAAGQVMIISYNSTAGYFESLLFHKGSVSTPTVKAVDSNGLNLQDDGGNGPLVNDGGYLTNGDQPAFSVKPTSDQTNIALASSVTVVFGTEIFDQGNDFASNAFTAPVTGKYQLNLNVQFKQMDTAASFYTITIHTSNRNYTKEIILSGLSADPSDWNFAFCVLADMDASDTVDILVYQSGGTQQSDIDTNTVFSGFLAC